MTEHAERHHDGRQLRSRARRDPAGGGGQAPGADADPHRRAGPRARPHRGSARPRQDADRAVASPRRWAWTSRGCSSPPTCCPPTCSARPSTTCSRAVSSSGAGRSSPTCCWPTRSTGPRPRRRPRCWRRWPSGRSASTASPTGCRSRSSCWPPTTRSSTRAPIRCPRRSSTGSRSGSSCAISPNADEASMLRRRLDRGSPEPDGATRSSTPHDLLAMRESVEQVTVHDDVLRYVVSLAAASRQHPQVAVGASPRAELDLVQLARARALLLGRDYVIPEDVKALAVPAMAHRISLRPEMWVRQVRSVRRRRGPAAPGPGAANPRRDVIDDRVDVRRRIALAGFAVGAGAGDVRGGGAWRCAVLGSRVAAGRVRRAAARRAGVDAVAAAGADGPRARRAGRAALLRGRARCGWRCGRPPTTASPVELDGRDRRRHARSRSRPTTPGRVVIAVSARAVGPLSRSTLRVRGAGARRTARRDAATVDGGRRLRVPGRARAVDRAAAHRAARPARHPPHPAHRPWRRVRQHPRLRAGRPTAHGQLAGQRAARQPARHRAAERARRRRRGARRHPRPAAGPGDRGDRADRARRRAGGAERAAQRRPRGCRRARRAAPVAGRRHRAPAVLPRARRGARRGRRLRDHDGHLGAAGGRARRAPSSSPSRRCSTPTSRWR